MRNIIIFILFISVNSVYAQLQSHAEIDSLLKEIPNMKEDSNMVNLLAKLSKNYYQLNPDKGIKYGKQGLELSKKINWKVGDAKCSNSIGANYIGKSNYSKAMEYFKKALKISKEQKYNIGISKNLGNIGLIYKKQTNYKKALEYYKQALKIDEEINNLEGVAKHLNYLSGLYGIQGDNKLALELLNKALKINKSISNKSNLAGNFQNISSIYSNQSNYPKALEYSLKALRINEDLGNLQGLSSVLNNLAEIYFRQSNISKSLEYLLKSLKINEKLGDKDGIAHSYSNIGSLYGVQKNYTKALEYFNKALKVFEEIGNEYGIIAILSNIGTTFTSQSNYSKAIEYMEKALNQSEKLGIKKGVALNLGNIGKLYLKQAEDSTIENSENKLELVLNKEVNLNKAIDYSIKAIKISKEIGELHYQSIYLANLSKAYRLKGDFKKALEIKDEYHELKDSIFSQKNNDKIYALESERAEDLKQAEIDKQKAIVIEQEKREKVIIYFSIGAFILMFVVVVIIIRLLRRSNKLLLNVLPAKIAKRLKAKEHPIADHFDNASIIFVDLVSFTKMSSSANPKEIVAMLNDIFTIFDKLADKHGLEKIKTIGDAYMAVAGIPEIQADHAKRTAQMALDIKQEMKDYKTADGTEIHFRIGIDCGAVVAGVIGEKKFIYDLWSDAVNTASRMESTGESGQIQITENFKNELEKYNGDWNFTLRGEFEIKGKGIMKTYFLEENNLGELK